ncbi:MAG: hypothetical protein FWC69_03060 [Defluviitaleaceae bacterium]|nr:hypothetical protein [Defluviitaleaceae bacterium]
MRKAIIFVLLILALFVFSGCPSRGNSYDDEMKQEDKLLDPKMSDFLDFQLELYQRNSLVAASFNFDGFSVWFTITPERLYSESIGGYFFNARITSNTTTAAVVSNVNGRYKLVDEIDVSFKFEPLSLSNIFHELPNDFFGDISRRITNHYDYQVSIMQTGHSGQVSSFTIHTHEQLFLIYISDCTIPNPIRMVVFSEDGIQADHTHQMLGEQARWLLRDIKNLTFFPEEAALIIESQSYRLYANINGVTSNIITPHRNFQSTKYGELILFDQLFNIHHLDAMAKIYMAIDFQTTNGMMYFLPNLNNIDYRSEELRLSRLNLEAGFQENVLIHNFYPETVFNHSFDDRGLIIYTEIAAYLFNHDFELTHKVSWPEEVDTTHIHSAWRFSRTVAFNHNFTKLAYSGYIDDVYGLYLFDLTTSSPPSLIRERIMIYDGGAYGGYPRFECPFPTRFTSNNKLLVGIVVWEGISFYELIDFEGNVLNHLPGGMIFLNPYMALFVYSLPSGFQYLNFKENTLHPANWWGLYTSEYHDKWMADRVNFRDFERLADTDTLTGLLYDPNNPYIWYISSIVGNSRWGEPDDATLSYIRRLDFENKTSEIIFSAEKTQITIISISPCGAIVFAYSGQEGDGFAIFCRD